MFFQFIAATAGELFQKIRSPVSTIYFVKGELLAQASNLKEENLVVEIDMSRSENVRRWWPFLRDRRIEQFQDLAKRFID